MPAAPEKLIEIGTRHQAHLEKLKTHDAKAFESFLKAMDRDISKRLAGKDLTAFTRRRLEALIAKVGDDLSAIYDGYRGVYREQVTELAKYEAGFEIRSLEQVVQHDFTLPGVNQLQSAVFAAPLSVQGPDGGKLLDSFYRDWSQKTMTRVQGALRAGYYQGQTTNQILQTIRGTRGNRFLDGLLQMSNKDAAMMVRTGLQHAASQAREQVWHSNSDIVKKVRWSSTLDQRTSSQCRSMDGREFDINKGPRPPLHIGCRSAVIAVLDERLAILREDATRSSRGPDGVKPVDAKETYYSWLKRQPKAFQDSAIGPKRAALLRDGQISAERFAEIGIGRNFEPLSLAEMAKLEPTAFEAAGL